MGKPNNEEQFGKLFDELADSVFRFCYFKVSDYEKAKDLTQETFFKAWRQVAAGVKIENNKAFLFRIANNLVIDEYRRKKTISLEQLQNQGWEAIGDEAGDIERFVQIGEALKLVKKLEPDDKQAVVMRFVDDLSIKEIAQILSENENTISVRIHRAIKKLKLIINGEKD